MRHFAWLSRGAIPPEFDLRRAGWELVARGLDAPAPPDCPVLAALPLLSLLERMTLLSGQGVSRTQLLVLGATDPGERARLLLLGVGEVLGLDCALDELDLRARRLASRLDSVPRHLRLGALRLDLMARDGFVAGQPLGLFPREFELLWRLAEAEGAPVSGISLLGEVWRLGFRPETNSLAVHVSRLRAKLRLAGLDGLVETLPGGAYRLAQHAREADLSDLTGQGILPLDGPPRLGKDYRERGNRRREEEQPDAPRIQAQRPRLDHA